MTLSFREAVGTCFGWCPNARPSAVPVPRTGARSQTGDLPDAPQSDSTPAIHAVPHWMTAVSIGILFATGFVGGNILWPIFVLLVLVFFVIIRIRSLQARRGS